jgi:hypothetical protein
MRNAIWVKYPLSLFIIISAINIAWSFISVKREFTAPVKKLHIKSKKQFSPKLLCKRGPKLPRSGFVHIETIPVFCFLSNLVIACHVQPAGSDSRVQIGIRYQNIGKRGGLPNQDCPRIKPGLGSSIAKIQRSDKCGAIDIMFES